MTNKLKIHEEKVIKGFRVKFVGGERSKPGTYEYQVFRNIELFIQESLSERDQVIIEMLEEEIKSIKDTRAVSEAMAINQGVKINILHKIIQLIREGK